MEWAVSFPARVPRAVILACGARATAEEIALCSLQIRAIEADPRFRGGDYYDAEPGEGPWRGMCLARGIGQVSYRSERSSTSASAAAAKRRRAARRRALRGESYLEYHGEKLAWRFDANTYIVLSRAMNHHDVGRGRGGVAAALARITGDVTIAGISSDRLYPLRLQHELAARIPATRASRSSSRSPATTASSPRPKPSARSSPAPSPTSERAGAFAPRR